MNKPKDAIENLLNSQRQLGADGCHVGVSRQALEEALEWLAHLEAIMSEIPRLTEWLRMDKYIEGYLSAESETVKIMEDAAKSILENA
jgi:hypothetical protein